MIIYEVSYSMRTNMSFEITVNSYFNEMLYLVSYIAQFLLHVYYNSLLITKRYFILNFIKILSYLEYIKFI